MDKKSIIKNAIKKQVPSGLDDLKLKIKKVPATNVPIRKKTNDMGSIPVPPSQMNPIQQQDWFRKLIPMAHKQINRINKK